MRLEVIVLPLGEGLGEGISEQEREKIKREWQKPENQEKLERLIEEFGKYKKVIDKESGVSYRVPTHDIITKGIKQQDLDKYEVYIE